MRAVFAVLYVKSGQIQNRRLYESSTTPQERFTVKTQDPPPPKCWRFLFGVGTVLRLERDAVVNGQLAKASKK